MFLVAKHGDFDDIFKLTNSMCIPITVSIEHENSGYLSFIDVYIHRQEDTDFQIITTLVYRKITFSLQ